MVQNPLRITKVAVPRIMKVFLFISLVTLLLFKAFGCDDDSGMEPQPRPEGWVFMGLADKKVKRVRLFGDYLYACAASDGLFRINVNNDDIVWEFLGLADSTLKRPSSDGVLDVAVLDETILVGYRSGRSDEPGIFRAMEGEFDWQPSDSGMELAEQIPFTSVVYLLSPSPWDTKTIFAGTTVGIVFKSSNLGDTWKPVYISGLAPVIRAIRFHPIRADEIWVGGQWFDGGILGRSTDSGENWEDMQRIIKTILFQQFGDSLVFPEPTFSDIAFDPAREDVMYLASDWLWKSQDAGETWSAVLDSFVRTVAINPTNPEEIFVSAVRFLNKTTDAAETWQSIPLPEPNSVMSFMEVDWQKRILYTEISGLESSSDVSGVYKMYF